MQQSWCFVFFLISFSALFRDFQRLSVGPKMVFFGAIIALVSVFFPWMHQTDLHPDDNGRLFAILQAKNGFQIFPVFGILSLFAAIFLLVTVFFFVLGRDRFWGFPPASLWIFFGGEALFLLFVAFFVFSSVVNDDTTASIRFGLFCSAGAYMMVFMGGLLFQQECLEKEQRFAFRPPVNPGHLGIRPENPRVSEKQLSLADFHDER